MVQEVFLHHQQLLVGLVSSSVDVRGGVLALLNTPNPLGFHFLLCLLREGERGERDREQREGGERGREGGERREGGRGGRGERGRGEREGEGRGRKGGEFA